MIPRSTGTPELASNVASRLDLTGGRQDAPARHHVVSRSYLDSTVGLSSPDDMSCYSLLAIDHGPFTEHADPERLGNIARPRPPNVTRSPHQPTQGSLNPLTHCQQTSKRSRRLHSLQPPPLIQTVTSL